MLADVSVEVHTMKESNGRTTHPVMLYNVTNMEGIQMYSSQSKGRAQYHADKLKAVLDPTLPYVSIADYDDTFENFVPYDNTLHCNIKRMEDTFFKCLKEIVYSRKMQGYIMGVHRKTVHLMMDGDDA